jgi:hypothetical protein
MARLVNALSRFLCLFLFLFMSAILKQVTFLTFLHYFPLSFALL